MQHFIGQTRNGKDVYVELIGSNASQQISRQPGLLSLAKEMLANTSASQASVVTERDMKRPLGYNFVVATTDKDSIFYGCLLKEAAHTRFVKNAKLAPTSYLTLTMVRDKAGKYELTSIRIGRLMPPLPGSNEETSDSRLFWADHAVSYDNQPLLAKTITKTCPY